MRSRRNHPWWFVPLVALMLVSSLPRVGCISADGTHLPYCQRVIDSLLEQVPSPFAARSATHHCSCCGCQAATQRATAGCGGTSKPCDCELTLEGPQWTAHDRAELTQTVELSPLVALAAVPPALCQAVGATTPRSCHDSPPRPALSAMVRLNV